MSGSCGCCVKSGRGLCNGLITRPEESFRVWCGCEASTMRRPWPTRGCRAIKKRFSLLCHLGYHLIEQEGIPEVGREVRNGCLSNGHFSKRFPTKITNTFPSSFFLPIRSKNISVINFLKNYVLPFIQAYRDHPSSVYRQRTHFRKQTFGKNV